jgi:hypothetical protein
MHKTRHLEFSFFIFIFQLVQLLIKCFLCFVFRSGLESKFIQGIIENISSTKLKRTPLVVADYPVRVKPCAKAVELLLNESNDVQMVGIHGLGGIGKTTNAKAVYNRNVDRFEATCFLENVRENSRTEKGIIGLQEKLLSETLWDKNLKVDNKSQGINVIKERLHNKKFLLILDDVWDWEQIGNLLGTCDWFASGSKVIITTRNRHMRATLGNVYQTYEVKELDKHEALQLFQKHAFQGNKPNKDYSKLANQVIRYAKGLPLALKIIGSDLCGRTKLEWESALKIYEEIPKIDIQLWV